MDEGWYRLLSVLVGTVGIWEGPMSIVLRLARDDGGSWQHLPNYLDSPWCYIVAVMVSAPAFALLAVLDTARKKALAHDRKIPVR